MGILWRKIVFLSQHVRHGPELELSGKAKENALECKLSSRRYMLRQYRHRRKRSMDLPVTLVLGEKCNSYRMRLSSPLRLKNSETYLPRVVTVRGIRPNNSMNRARWSSSRSCSTAGKTISVLAQLALMNGMNERKGRTHRMFGQNADQIVSHQLPAQTPCSQETTCQQRYHKGRQE
eukprot:SAG31_NODE_508_length_14732_cov_75.624547_11_plen_177_part_00